MYVTLYIYILILSINTTCISLFKKNKYYTFYKYKNKAE